MIVYSDSTFWALAALAVTSATVVICAVCVSFMFSRQIRNAVRTLFLAVGLAGTYVLGFIALTPQRTVMIGQSYCQDIWCIGLDRLATSPHGQGIEYKIAVHLFSDANRVQTSAKGYRIYLQD